MKQTNKKYKICDYNHIPDYYSYINVDTTSPTDGWVTDVPMCKKKFKLLESAPTPVKYFETKTEAKEYLDVIKSYRLNDWDKNRHIYMVNGYKKPQWKIYEEMI